MPFPYFPPKSFPKTRQLDDGRFHFTFFYHSTWPPGCAFRLKYQRHITEQYLSPVSLYRHLFFPSSSPAGVQQPVQRSDGASARERSGSAGPAVSAGAAVPAGGAAGHAAGVPAAAECSDHPAGGGRGRTDAADTGEQRGMAGWGVN